MAISADDFNTDPRDFRSEEDATMIGAGDELAQDLGWLFSRLWLKERGYSSGETLEGVMADIEVMLFKYLEKRRQFAEKDGSGLLDQETVGSGPSSLIASSLEADVAHAKARLTRKLH